MLQSSERLGREGLDGTDAHRQEWIEQTDWALAQSVCVSSKFVSGKMIAIFFISGWEQKSLWEAIRLIQFNEGTGKYTLRKMTEIIKKQIDNYHHGDMLSLRKTYK